MVLNFYYFLKKFETARCHDILLVINELVRLDHQVGCRDLLFLLALFCIELLLTIMITVSVAGYYQEEEKRKKFTVALL